MTLRSFRARGVRFTPSSPFHCQQTDEDGCAVSGTGDLCSISASPRLQIIRGLTPPREMGDLSVMAGQGKWKGWRQLHDEQPVDQRHTGPRRAVNPHSGWVALINDTHSGNTHLGNGTYTVWASSCGRSACSGNTGCGGSPMGTQPRDLLMAWLSFLAGDFCEESRRKNTKGCHLVWCVWCRDGGGGGSRDGFISCFRKTFT